MIIIIIIINNNNITSRRSNINAPDLYSEGTCFECLTWHSLQGLKILAAVFGPIGKIPGWYPNYQ